MSYSGTKSERTHAGAQHFVKTIRRLRGDEEPARILVAGCGQAHEARYIHDEMGGELVGVDVDSAWDPVVSEGARPGFTLRTASVLDLPFADSSFDAIFYHHVIEHVPDPERSLQELARVLRPGGLIYVGTPNRNRVVGYLGSYDASLKEKVRYNVADYSARLRGRFRNELGAHAGFSQRELHRLLTAQFRDPIWLTAEYLEYKYGDRVPEWALRTIGVRAVREVLAPSVYAVARR